MDELRWLSAVAGAQLEALGQLVEVSWPDALNHLWADVSVSLTGQPALSLPLHQTEGGLPVGIQLVGARGADEMLLRLAEDLQRVADWTVRRPQLI